MLSEAKHLVFPSVLESRDFSAEFILSKVEGPQNDITIQPREGERGVSDGNWFCSRSARQARFFRDAEHEIKVLNRHAGRAFAEVIQPRHQQNMTGLVR